MTRFDNFVSCISVNGHADHPATNWRGTIRWRYAAVRWLVSHLLSVVGNLFDMVQILQHIDDDRAAQGDSYVGRSLTAASSRSPRKANRRVAPDGGRGHAS